MRRFLLVLGVLASAGVAATAFSAPIAPTQPGGASPTISPTGFKPPLPPKQPIEDKCSGSGPLQVFLSFSGNANDASGNCRNGAVIDAVLTKDRFGADNAAYDFNNGGHINIGKTAGLALPKRTIALWFRQDKPPVLGAAGDCMSAVLLAQDGMSLEYKNCGRRGWGLAYSQRSAEQNGFVLLEDRKTQVTSGTWYHVAVTFDGTTARMYVNGKVTVSDTTGGTPVTSANAIRVGKPLFADRDRRGFQGAIDEIRIYSSALSDAEVASVYGSR